MGLDAETAYLFRHALLRDAAYQLQPPADRAGLHKTALEVLTPLVPEGADGDGWALELAEHAQRASLAPGADAEALGRTELNWLMRAASHEQRQWHNRKAVDLLLRAAGHAQAAPRERANALHDACSVLMGSGGHRDVPPLLEQAQRLVAKLGDDALYLRSASLHTRYAIAVADYAGARAHVELGLQLARKLDDRQQHGSLLNYLAQLCIAGTDHEGAREAAQQALEVLHGTGHATGISRAYLYLGDTAWQEGNLSEAETHLRKSIEVLENGGHPAALASALDHLGSLLQGRMRLDEAESLHRRALLISQQVGEQVGVASITANIANLETARGFHDRARELYIQSLGACRAAGVATQEGVVLGNLGMVARQTGRLAEGVACLEGARRIFARSGRVVEQAVFTGALGQLCLLTGDIARADALLHEAYTALKTAGAARWREHYVGVGLVRLLAWQALSGGDLDAFRAQAAVTMQDYEQGAEGIRQIIQEVEHALAQHQPARLFRGFLVADLSPQARVALLDSMSRQDPKAYVALQANTELWLQMQQDTQGLPVPPWNVIEIE
ncbi:MAG: tetratricopeptide repeat protein [Planctomycetes bacterium]|nr:tetratricopeptide repeat protein [Planctomycetota bacterium]MCW8136032.1 tetratricopeptide repeat protein [Planctomycetota bacterium]